MRTKLLIFGSALLLASACATTDTTSTTGDMSSGSMSSGSMSNMNGMSMTYSDRDIASIVATASQGEIDEGQTASTRANSAEVRSFAQMMVTDHTNALNQGRDLFSRQGITPSDNDISRNLMNNAQQTVGALTTYSGAGFDRQYMQTQVDVHQWLLSTLDNTLIPSASDRQLKSFLQTQRTAVAMHLDRARQILNGVR